MGLFVFTRKLPIEELSVPVAVKKEEKTEPKMQEKTNNAESSNKKNKKEKDTKKVEIFGNTFWVFYFISSFLGFLMLMFWFFFCILCSMGLVSCFDIHLGVTFVISKWNENISLAQFFGGLYVLSSITQLLFFSFKERFDFWWGGYTLKLILRLEQALSLSTKILEGLKPGATVMMNFTQGKSSKNEKSEKDEESEEEREEEDKNIVLKDIFKGTELEEKIWYLKRTFKRIFEENTSTLKSVKTLENNISKLQGPVVDKEFCFLSTKYGINLEELKSKQNQTHAYLSQKFKTEKNSLRFQADASLKNLQIIDQTFFFEQQDEKNKGEILDFSVLQKIYNSLEKTLLNYQKKLDCLQRQSQFFSSDSPKFKALSSEKVLEYRNLKMVSLDISKGEITTKLEEVAKALSYVEKIAVTLRFTLVKKTPGLGKISALPNKENYVYLNDLYVSLQEILKEKEKTKEESGFINELIQDCLVDVTQSNTLTVENIGELSLLYRDYPLGFSNILSLDKEIPNIKKIITFVNDLFLFKQDTVNPKKALQELLPRKEEVISIKKRLHNFLAEQRQHHVHHVKDQANTGLLTNEGAVDLVLLFRLLESDDRFKNLEDSVVKTQRFLTNYLEFFQTFTAALKYKNHASIKISVSENFFTFISDNLSEFNSIIEEPFVEPFVGPAFTRKLLVDHYSKVLQNSDNPTFYDYAIAGIAGSNTRVVGVGGFGKPLYGLSIDKPKFNESLYTYGIAGSNTRVVSVDGFGKPLYGIKLDQGPIPKFNVSDSWTNLLDSVVN